jgi:hypothetical protein
MARVLEFPRTLTGPLSVSFATAPMLSASSKRGRETFSEWTREHREREAAPQDAESCATDHELERAGPEEQRRGDGPN